MLLYGSNDDDLPVFGVELNVNVKLLLDRFQMNQENI